MSSGWDVLKTSIPKSACDPPWVCVVVRLGTHPGARWTPVIWMDLGNQHTAAKEFICRVVSGWRFAPGPEGGGARPAVRLRCASPPGAHGAQCRRGCGQSCPGRGSGQRSCSRTMASNLTLCGAKGCPRFPSHPEGWGTLMRPGSQGDSETGSAGRCNGERNPTLHTPGGLSSPLPAPKAVCVHSASAAAPQGRGIPGSLIGDGSR